MIISINTDNAAFQDGAANDELKRIILKALERYEIDPNEEKDRPDRYPLRDINGNKCGYIEI